MEKMAGKKGLQPTAPIIFLVQATKSFPSNFVKMKYHCCLVGLGLLEAFFLGGGRLLLFKQNVYEHF